MLVKRGLQIFIGLVIVATASLLIIQSLPDSVLSGYAHKPTPILIEKEVSQEEMNSMYRQVAVDGRRETFDSVNVPGLSKFVYEVLDKQCPFYEPDGASYRDCLWNALDSKKLKYTGGLQKAKEIEAYCQSVAADLEGLIAGEVVLSCTIFKLTEPA